MTQLAVGYRDGANGRQQRSDGLIKHLGTIDSGALRVTDNQLAAVKLGQGAELAFDRPSKTGYLVAYDRELPGYLDLAIQGKSIAIFPQGGSLQLPANAIDGSSLKAGTVTTTELAANAAQQLRGSYVTTPTWQTNTSGYQETPIAVTAVCGGGLIRLESTFCFYHSAVGAGMQFAYYLDGGMLSGTLAVLNQPVAGYVMCVTLIYYYVAAAGSHRFAIAINNLSAGMFTLYTGTAQTLYVTEQKR